MKSPGALSHYRLLTTKVFALALVLSALIFLPPDAAAEGDWFCETGCINWNAQQGCTEYMTCCVNDRGGYFCLGA
jgi:hypothetical protein